jgi:Na+-transporting methylmalonyl-CoA/oxaloacetate decarboxylase gamma subunit
VAAAAARPAGAGPAAVALALGVAGLAAGFVVLPLLASVVAITMGSLGLQAVSEGRADPSIARRLRAAIGCGVAALVIWIPVVVAAAVAQS